jgi:hypothetical protein
MDVPTGGCETARVRQERIRSKYYSTRTQVEVEDDGNNRQAKECACIEEFISITEEYT